MRGVSGRRGFELEAIELREIIEHAGAPQELAPSGFDTGSPRGGLHSLVLRGQTAAPQAIVKRLVVGIARTLRSSTTNAGKSWFSLPRPWLSHADAGPVPWLEEGHRGSWLIPSVCIDLMKQSSSAMAAMGQQVADPRAAWPRRVKRNLLGATGKLSCREVMPVSAARRIESGGSVAFRQARFVIEQIELRGRGLKRVNDAFGPRAVRLGGRRSIGRERARPTPSGGEFAAS